MGAIQNWYDARILPRMLNTVMRTGRFAPYRKRAVRGSKGRVLEIGVGSGVNLPLYPPEVREVIGLDPHAKLLAFAGQVHGTLPVHLVRASAEAIPLATGSIDTILMTWTLCSVPYPQRALTEMRRVLRPGGQLHFVEHGLAPDERVQRWQHRLTPAWRHLAGGCHLDRPIEQLVRDAGLEIAGIATGYMQGPRPMTYMYEGRARKTEHAG